VPDTGERTRASRVGAYGLRIEGLGRTGRLLQRVPASWPRLLVRTRVGVRQWEGDTVDPERALLELHDRGGVEVVRRGLEAVVVHPDGVRAAGIAHPYLAPIAAVVAHWLGRQSFHAGAFVVGQGAWGVLGDRGSGKSSLLAALAAAGAGIVADDVVVVEEGRAFAGPRTLDLRRDAAGALGMGQPLGVVGTRERWRVPVAGVMPELPLLGWVRLEWASGVSLEPLPPAERLVALARQRAVMLPPPDPGALLQLAALRGYVLRRPREWHALATAVHLLLDRLGDPRSPATPPAAR
jgi:hypothetical protein